MTRSAIEAVRNGAWRRPTVGRFELLAAVGAGGDAVTTAYILHTSGHTEANRAIDAMASIHPTVGAVGFAAFLGSLLAIALLSFGWLSDAAAGFLVCSPGVSAVHNVVGFRTGVWLLRELTLPMYLTVGLLLPTVGFLVGLTVATRKGTVPRGEVAVGIAIVLGGGLVGTAL